MDYLRNRPFLVVEISQRPAENVDTKKKGWQNEPGAMKSYEKVSFLDRINKQQELRSAIIIDIIESKLIKNLSTRSENEVIATYFGRYKEEVKQALSVWAEREARRLATQNPD